MALAKNKQRKELIEWSSDRKAEEHLDIVWVLQHEKPEKWADDELKFWLAVAKRDPGSIAYTLRLWGGPTPAELRETIRAYLKNEIAKPTVKNGGSQPAYNLQAAVYVLDGWQEAADNPLLLKYLGHPVHNSVTRLDGARQTELRVYGLRSHVRVMLEKRGVKVPDGVVYEQEIGN
jgi:hypothetical protein